MKLVSYLDDDEPAYGVLMGDHVVRGARLGPWRSIKELLEAAAMPEVASKAASVTPELRMADLALLPVIPDPAKILCVGLNYRTHREEAGRAEVERPTVFIRFADSQTACSKPVVCPPSVTKLDYEGEVAVVIGRGGRDIPVGDAAAYVAGYACYNDFSARDWQAHSTQWTAGKNLPGTGAFGPCLVTPDEIADVSALKLETRVNGEVRQSAFLTDLIFNVPDLISYISSFTPLSIGDVIVTGTPGGVGLFREPPVFLATGDVVEVEVTGLGTLTNVVIAARAA